ncbi:hypothetical protein HK405_006529, partial [Cladochytrium tenue]
MYQPRCVSFRQLRRLPPTGCARPHQLPPPTLRAPLTKSFSLQCSSALVNLTAPAAHDPWLPICPPPPSRMALPIRRASSSAGSSRRGGKKQHASGGGGGSHNHHEDDEAAAHEPPFDRAALAADMTRVVDHLKVELAAIRAGRANPALLDAVRISHKGASLPLRELAHVSVRDGQTLLVAVHDEEHVKLADKAIRDAGLGLNPVREQGKNTLRVPIPKADAAQREAARRDVARLAERARTVVRELRATARNRLRKTRTKKVEDE